MRSLQVYIPRCVVFHFYSKRLSSEAKPDHQGNIGARSAARSSGSEDPRSGGATWAWAWAGHATVRCLCASAGGRTQLRLRGGV